MNSKLNVQPAGVFHLIVVPHDMTIRSDKAVQLAGTMAVPKNSEVVLVNVICPADFNAGEPDQLVNELAELTKARHEFLQSAAKRLLPDETKYKVRILSGDPESVIMTEVQELGADLLIVTTHPLAGTGYPFWGRKASQILQAVPCPVLTIKVPKEDEAALLEEEIKYFRPHDLNQYCELSGRLSKTQSFRPVFTGYSCTPSDILGGCH